LEVFVRNAGLSLALIALSIAATAAPGQVSMTIQTGKQEPVVVGLPYTADQTVQTVQHLANGMALTHQVTGHVYRSADGLERVEATFPSTDPAQPDPVTLICLLDPAKHTATTLNSKLKTATVTPLPDKATVTFTFLPLPRADASAQAAKLEDITTTDLGKRTQNMMDLVGKRVTGTIPAGRIGNAQPLTITSEVWMAPQLKLIVKQVEENPVTGERTFELTNIRNQEPDPALFKIPDGYTIKQRSAMPTSAPPQLGTPPQSPAPAPALAPPAPAQPIARAPSPPPIAPAPAPASAPGGPPQSAARESSPTPPSPEQSVPPKPGNKQIKEALSSSDPGLKNDVAYALALNRDHFPDAQLLVEQALPIKEQQVADAVSATDPAQAFDQMVALSRFWDTTGYVYYRSGKPAKAEPYLRAAWELNPNGLFALHLGLAYESQHKILQALNTYRMGLGAKPSPDIQGALQTCLTRLGESGAPPLPVDVTTPLPKFNLPLIRGEQEPLVDILLSHNHPPAVTLLQGNSAIQQPLTDAIQSALASALPDSGPELVVRQARVACEIGATVSCTLHFTNTREFTAAEQARRDALRHPQP
jgi:hypothetical protein